MFTHQLKSLGLSLILMLAVPQALARETDNIGAVIETNMGNIEIELYANKAPVTVENFVRYITSEAYNNGQFYRVVRLDNDNGSPQIEVIQGGANTAFTDFAPIALETTAMTGIRHQDGTLSMARGEPNSATSAFFICIGEQAALDFGGERNPDGQGFAAFGKVTGGMEVVKGIHGIKATKQTDDAYVQGQILQDPVVIQQIKLL